MERVELVAYSGPVKVRRFLYGPVLEERLHEAKKSLVSRAKQLDIGPKVEPRLFSDGRGNFWEPVPWWCWD